MGRKVSFSDDVAKIPEHILDSYFRPFTSCHNDAFCSSLKASSETQERSALVLQRFIRNNIPHWRYFNNEKSRIIEEMDDVLLIKEGELERVSDCIAEMKREAEMEAALECDGEEIEDDQDLKAQVDEKKAKVKEYETENSRLKNDSEDLKKKNKRMAMETFGVYESFTQAMHDVKGLQLEQKRLENICELYSKMIKTLKGMRKTVKMDIKRERKERQELEECINEIEKLLMSWKKEPTRGN